MNFEIFFSVFFAVFCALAVFEFVKPRLVKSETLREVQRIAGIKEKVQIISPSEVEKKKQLLNSIPDE